MVNDIIIDLDSDTEYLNDYDDNKINDNLAKYIMDSVVDLNYDVVLNIKFKYKVDEEEIDNVKEKINYTFKFLERQNESYIKKSNYRNIFLILFGILFFWLYKLFDVYNLSVLSEIMNILSWVALWSFGENLLFARRKFNIKRKKIKKVFEAKINIEVEE